MRTNVKRTLTSTVGAVALLLSAGCELDLQNPNAPTEEEVVTSIDGAVALAVGMQDQFASSVDDFLVTSSLITDEWGTQTLALVSYRSLVDGESFDPSFLVVEAPWAASYETIKSANTLLGAVPELELGVGLRTGILATAKLFKAMAFGVLIQNYEQVPIDVSVEGPVPEGRAVVLDTILGLLESARSDLAGVTDDDLTVFRQRVLGTGFDLRNTIDAMLARYYLIGEQYAEALAASERVALDAISVFTYAAPDRNPVENLAFQLRYVAALESFATAAEAGDQRVGYWVDATATPFTGNPDSLLLPIAKFSGPTEAFPVYLPDEMRLIMAEAYTQMGMFTEARDAINAVRTQSSSSLDEPVATLGALDATDLPDGDTDAFLAQIAYERRYELYMQGLRWEDVRRLGEAITTTPVMDFLPIPQQECDTNPSNPCG
jgi:hypothetical protein